MIELLKEEIFSNNVSTLKELSKDTSNKIYLVQAENEGINFDKVKRYYANGLGATEECLKSVDALVIINGVITFIEFKNCKINTPKSDEICRKANDSFLIMCGLADEKVSTIIKKINLILVYAQDKNSSAKQAIGKHIAGLAKEEIIRFNLSKLEKAIFNEVHTYNESEFEAILKEANLTI